MILIIGGSCQGKTEFAATLAGQELKQESEQALRPDLAADGRQDDFAQAFEKPVILYFHQFIARLLEQDMDPAVFTKTVIEQNPDIVILNEVGYGIVPIERAGRRYREAVGRAGQLLAANAEAVYRVICGIGTRIK